MARIFWVTCPKCRGRFCCHFGELRHNTTHALLCPYCTHRFFDSESPLVEE